MVKTSIAKPATTFAVKLDFNGWNKAWFRWKESPILAVTV